MSYDLGSRPSRLVYWYPGSQHLPIVPVASPIPTIDEEDPDPSAPKHAHTPFRSISLAQKTNNPVMRHAKLVNYTRTETQELHWFEIHHPVSPTISDCSTARDSKASVSSQVLGWAYKHSPNGQILSQL